MTFREERSDASEATTLPGCRLARFTRILLDTDLVHSIRRKGWIMDHRRNRTLEQARKSENIAAAVWAEIKKPGGVMRVIITAIVLLAGVYTGSIGFCILNEIINTGR